MSCRIRLTRQAAKEDEVISKPQYFDRSYMNTDFRPFRRYILLGIASMASVLNAGQEVQR